MKKKRDDSREADRTHLRSFHFTPVRSSEFASRYFRRYYGNSMRCAPRLWLYGFVLIFLLSICPLRAANNSAIFPLSDVKPGMKGEMYTIFSGDQIEKTDLEVIGVLHNAVGPKLDVILVRLLGDQVQQTGVVAGMSGSPVYFDGKLAGALALKLGTFTKEAIGGVTPIQDMLEVEQSRPAVSPTTRPSAVQEPREAAQTFAGAGIGSKQLLVPIETPLITTGLYPETLAQIRQDFFVVGHDGDGRRHGCAVS